MTREIHIAAAVIVRSGGKVLLVRKRGSAVFMQPGGKIEPGETPVAALRRELAEEIGLADPAPSPLYLGRFEAPAGNEPDATVIAETYLVVTDLSLAAQAEIEELRWVEAAARTADMALLTRDHILPAYHRWIG